MARVASVVHIGREILQVLRMIANNHQLRTCLIRSTRIVLLTASESKNISRGSDMLWTLFVILLVLWLLGVVSSYTLGGFIHILLVLAVIALVFQLISGRRPVV